MVTLPYVEIGKCHLRTGDVLCSHGSNSRWGAAGGDEKIHGEFDYLRRCKWVILRLLNADLSGVPCSGGIHLRESNGVTNHVGWTLSADLKLLNQRRRSRFGKLLRRIGLIGRCSLGFMVMSIFLSDRRLGIGATSLGSFWTEDVVGSVFSVSQHPLNRFLARNCSNQKRSPISDRDGRIVGCRRM